MCPVRDDGIDDAVATTVHLFCFCVPKNSNNPRQTNMKSVRSEKHLYFSQSSTHALVLKLFQYLEELKSLKRTARIRDLPSAAIVTD